MAPAMVRPISVSKPMSLPPSACWPNSGWSNLVPIRMACALAILAIVVPGSKWAPWATGGVEPSVPGGCCCPHPATAIASAASAAPTLSTAFQRIRYSSCRSEMVPGRDQQMNQSVRHDLAEKVSGACGARCGEEQIGRGILDDLAVGHEHHPIRGAAGEAHLVGDH